MFVKIEIVNGVDNFTRRIDLPPWFDQYSCYTVHLMLYGFISSVYPLAYKED